MRRETYNRIEGQANQGDLDEMKQAAQNLAGALLEEGFDSADIAEFLQGAVKAEVEAVESITRENKDATVTMGQSSHCGTGFQGYMPEGTRIADIVKVFGRPTILGSQDNKVNVEWIGEIDGQVFTIYDYKSDKDPKDNTDWNIGGKKKATAAMVVEYFNARRS